MISTSLSLFIALHDASKYQTVTSQDSFTIQFDHESDLRHAIYLLIGSVVFRWSVMGLKITVRGI